jgi:hypothetical protein
MKNGEKLYNTVTKIIDKIYESRRTTGGFGSPFPLQKQRFATHLCTSLKKPKGRGKT